MTTPVYVTTKTLDQRYRELLRNLVLKSEQGKVYVTNEQLATEFGVTERCVKRWLHEFKQRGWITTVEGKHFKPGFGWCNARAIILQDIGLIRYGEMNAISKG